LGLVCSRAFWLVARQIVRVSGLIVCVGVAVFSREINAQLPPAHPQAPGSAVQTITGADLTAVVNLDGPWRFRAGDDPSFADPALDDSAWPAIRTDQPLKAVGVHDITGRYLWTRIHLRVPTAAGRLALALYTRGADQYEIFVNGLPVGSTPGMATRTPRFGPAVPVALPPAGDIVLAIRFYCAIDSVPYLPIWRLSLGSFASIQTATELDHLRTFNDFPLMAFICISKSLLIAIIAIVLYRVQRDHDEYLWLGFVCLHYVIYTLIDADIGSGRLPFTPTVLLPLYYFGGLGMAVNIEFVIRFTRIRRIRLLRILQGLIVIEPTLVLSPLTQSLNPPILITVWVAMGAVYIACFVSAYRRDLADAVLFLVPCMAMVVLNLAFVATWMVPPSVLPWKPVYHIGPVGFPITYLGSFVFDLGIVAVVLYRFIRVARDEERAAAEFEAARTVQQILVPEEIPSIPGFAIEAVYHPAGQVGGDFYQVLPTRNAGLLAIIGDVSGKGMPAAMTVSLLVGTVRTLAHYTHDPAEILAAMNQRMLGRGSGFTTCLVLRLDPDGTLTTANAGHLAPYVNGKELDLSNGLPLGITASAIYSNSMLHLEAGTTLTLLTDGVVEAQNDKGELFGFDRSRDLSTRPAAAIVEAARAFGQEDDITVLAVGFAPAEVSRA
jgi:hypothetical protein